jgi:hypothetical protein
MLCESPFFHQVLQRHPEAVAELPPETFRRYASGELPRAVQWLMRHPAMLRTIADFVEATDAKTAQRTRRASQE